MPNLSINKLFEFCLNLGFATSFTKNVSTAILCCILATGFNEGVHASEPSAEFIFNCSKQGEVVVPNTGEPFSRFDPNNSDVVNKVEYTPSFSKTGILLRSDREDFFINLENGDLLFRTEVIEKCEILQKPANYKLSSNEFMFFCTDQGGLVIPNTGETFYSDWDGVEFQPSFSKTGIFLKSDVGNYVINLKNGDLLFGDDLSSDDVAESCDILRRPEQNASLNLQSVQITETQVTETGELRTPSVESINTKDQNFTIKDLIERDGLFYEKSSGIPFTGMVSGLERGNFVDGLKEGEWIEYHQNGNVKIISNYISGKEEGYIVGWYDNGQLDFDGYTKNGEAHGIDVYYDEDGRLVASGEWRNGQRVGLWIILHEDSSGWFHREYELDSPRYTETTFYVGGQIKDQAERLQNGNLDGSVETYYENGQIKVEGEFENGVVVGLYKKYFEDGTIDDEISGFYEDGTKVRGLSSRVNRNKL